MAATGAAGAGFTAVAGGMRLLSGVRKDTYAALPMRARTPATANRLNPGGLSGRRRTSVRGMFSGTVVTDEKSATSAGPGSGTQDPANPPTSTVMGAGSNGRMSVPMMLISAGWSMSARSRGRAGLGAIAVSGSASTTTG
jgi:hypothetical protein